MIGWYCPNKFQCNILLCQFELSPLHCWLNMKKNGVRGEIWRQKPWQIPYPMENWKMRYMVVWIQRCGSGDLSLIVRNNITDVSHDLIISVGNNIIYVFIVH
jgi:hypothetical protein